VAVTSIDMVRIAEGRIVEHRGLTDMVGLMRQLTE
jgi:predicted ester cyclase